MNNNIRKLHAMATSDHRIIIGLMSGTSLDGLDIALCKISGSGINTKVSLEAFQTIDYSDEISKIKSKKFSQKIP
jgi:anhydro-N-acetylmuramic acid kinase